MPAPLTAAQRRHLLLTGFLAFIVVGGSQALYGPSFDAFRARHGVGAGAVGLVVSLHFLGSIVTNLASGALIRRWGYRRPLAAFASCLALGAFTIGIGPSWTWVLAGALLVGLGYGVLNVAVNLLFARGFERGAAPALNVLNAMFGLGAALAPALVALSSPRLAPPYLATAGLALVVAVSSLRLATPPPTRAQRAGGGPLNAAAVGFVMLFFMYVATEVGTSAWATDHLTPHHGLDRAAFVTSLFWAAITVGRLVVAPLSALVPPHALVLGAVSVAAVAALATRLVPVAPWAYLLLGLSLAPVFPTALAWLQRAFPARAEQLTPFALAGGMLGGVATPPLVGLAVAARGSDVVPTVLFALAGGLLLLVVALVARSPLRASAGASGGDRAGPASD